MKNIEIYHQANNNYSNISNDNTSNIEINNDYIAGTRIKKPRAREIYESDEDYIKYLKKYYSTYFPNPIKDTHNTYIYII